MFLIKAARDGGFYVRVLNIRNGDLEHGAVIFAGNIHTCLAYLRKALEAK